MSVLSISDHNERRQQRQELKEWRKRLELCYTFDWADPCRAICHTEVERLKKLVEGEETILDKIAKMR
jgi:hypothetical protein